MSRYYPDKWVIFKFDYLGKPEYKILGSWAGGYLDGDSWRTSSGITSIEEHEDHYFIHNYSGSEYYCHKQSIGMRMYAAGVWNDISTKESSIAANIALVDIADILPALLVPSVNRDHGHNE